MRKLVTYCVLGMFLIVPYGLHALTDTATGQAQVEIVAPLDLEHDSAAILNFGKIMPSLSTTGSVTLSAAATAAITASSEVTVVDTSTVSADHFTVANAGSATPYSAAISEGSISVKNDATTLTITPALSCSSDCATGDIYVGGTLSIPAKTNAGTYTGTYNLAITY